MSWNQSATKLHGTTLNQLGAIPAQRNVPGVLEGSWAPNIDGKAISGGICFTNGVAGPPPCGGRPLGACGGPGQNCYPLFTQGNQRYMLGAWRTLTNILPLRTSYPIL